MNTTKQYFKNSFFKLYTKQKVADLYDVASEVLEKEHKTAKGQAEIVFEYIIKFAVESGHSFKLGLIDAMSVARELLHQKYDGILSPKDFESIWKKINPESEKTKKMQRKAKRLISGAVKPTEKKNLRKDMNIISHLRNQRA